jgi:hypothetical protein
VQNVCKIQGVMARGRWISKKELDEFLEAIAVLVRAKVLG